MFAPGVWEGFNRSQAIDRERAQEASIDAGRRQTQEWQRMQMEDVARQRAMALRDQELQGAVLGRAYGAPPPLPQVAPAPAPGTNSAAPPPPQAPQMLGPQGQQAVGGPPPGPPMQSPPPGAPPQGAQPIPQAPAPAPGANSGPVPVPPYRTREAALQPQMPQPAPAGPGAPPPVGGPPQGGDMPGAPPRLSVQSIVQSAQAAGAKPEELARVVANMSPLMQNQLSEELAHTKAGMQQANAYMKQLELGIKQAREAAQEKRWESLSAQGQQKQDRLSGIGTRSASAVAGGPPAVGTPGGKKPTQEQQDALDLKAWNYIDNRVLPARKGKGGPNDPNEIVMARAAAIGRELNMSMQELAAAPASFKAAASAMMQNTKDLSAIRPYKEMLDTNISVALDLSKKIVQSDSKLANKTLNWAKQNLGDNPDAAEYLAQMAFVQTESARVLNNPRLVGQLTDSARHEMQQVVNGDMPLGSSERVLKRIKSDGENRVNAMVRENDRLKRDLSNRGASKGGETSGGKDAEAIAWAKSNPADPRAKKILSMHGM